LPPRTKTDPLSDLIADAFKTYDGLKVGNMDDVADDVFAVSTGNMAIDSCVGVGGLPLGRSIELYGPPSCGKTTTALQWLAQVQKIIKAGGDPTLGIKADDRLLYLDYEQAMDKEYAKALGLDTSHESLLFAQPDTLEQGVNFAIQAVETGRVRAVVFDSVAAMNPSAKAEAEIGKSLPMIQAKLMKDFTLRFNTALYTNNATAIFLNHLMEVVSMGGASRPGMPPPSTTPGGKALKYFASVRIEFKQIRQNKGPFVDPLTNETVQIVTSTDVKIKVTKNKVAPAFREAVVRVRFGRGFDNLWTALQVLIANKRIMYQGGMYYFHNVEEVGLAPEWMKRATTGTNRPYIKGEPNVFAKADEFDEWRNALIAEAERIVAQNADAMSLVTPLKPVADVDDESEDEEFPDVDPDTGVITEGENRVSFTS
jgi:recombination protein RecA